jgi:hypothetical protein
MPPPVKSVRNSWISAKQRDQRQATILETYFMLRDDLLHLPAQLAHLVISIDVSKQFHEAKPVVRCEGPVVTRVERATNLINKIPEHGHQCSQAFGVNNVANGPARICSGPRYGMEPCNRFSAAAQEIEDSRR